MRKSPDTSPRPSRRAFLKVGITAGIVLVGVHWLYRATHLDTGESAHRRAPIDDRHAVLGAIIPVMLDGALAGGSDRREASAEVLAGIDEVIAGLPPASREELERLFSLLAFAPTRALATGVWSSWTQASPAAVNTFLDRWRDSRLALFRSAYAALHQLIFAAWYGNPRAWPAASYAGPPSIDWL